MKNRLILSAFAATLLSTAAIAQTSSPSSNQTQPPAPAPAPMAPKATEPSTTGSTAPRQDANAPLPGANSFTQAQAKSRIEQQGFTGVSELAKDDKGVWRGNATKDGKGVTVTLDFRGNVTAQ